MTNKRRGQLDTMIFEAALLNNVKKVGQKDFIESVVKNIEQIVVVAEETAAGSEEVATSATEMNAAMVDVKSASNNLSEIAAELQTGVSTFKISKEIVKPKRGRNR